MFSIGQRVAKSPVIGATVYHYDVGGKLIAESDSFGVMQKEYVYLYDQAVAVYGSMNTSQCSATPAEVNGTGFTANNTLERLEGRSGKPGAADWEWGLGYNTQLSGGFTKGEWTWASGKAYSFTLTYDGLGNGSYQVRDNGVVLLTKTYTGSPGKQLRTGNALQVWVKANANVGTAKVNLTVNSMNGTSLNKTIQTAGNNLYSFDAATFEGQSLTTGFTLNGTVTLTFTGTIPYGSRLNFAVTAGNTTCATQQQKQLGYIYSDHLDTPRLIKNGQGQALWSWDSDAFGTTNANENPSNLGTYNFNLRFPGQYYDKETKTHYNYFRDYDPGTGRYRQSDPIGLQGGMNTFAYVSGDPISRSDPSGLKWGSSDFVSQFYFGKGRPVDLASIGLLTDFTNSASVKQGATGIIAKLHLQAQSVGASLRNSCTCSLNVVTQRFSLSDKFDYNVTGGSPANRLWSIGRGKASVSASCFAYFDCFTKTGRWNCSINNSVRDTFTQPLIIQSYGINIRGNFGGTTYGINADWTSSFSGTF